MCRLNLWGRHWTLICLTCTGAYSDQTLGLSLSCTSSAHSNRRLLGSFLTCSRSYAKDCIQCQFFPTRQNVGQFWTISSHIVLYDFPSSTDVDNNHSHELRTYSESGSALIVLHVFTHLRPSSAFMRLWSGFGRKWKAHLQRWTEEILMTGLLSEV